MSHLDQSIRRCVLIACALWLCGITAVPGQSSSTNTAPTFSITIKNGEMLGTEQARRAFIYSGPHEFVINLPSEHTPDTSNPAKFVMTPADRSYYLSFRITDIPSPEAGADYSEYYRERLARLFAGSRVLEESSYSAARHDGPMYDLSWKTPGGIEQFVRVAYIPSPAGVLEFMVVADARKPGPAQRALRLVMRGFMSNERGPIKIIPGDGKT
jgi:hypothetical protein